MKTPKRYCGKKYEDLFGGADYIDALFHFPRKIKERIFLEKLSPEYDKKIVAIPFKSYNHGSPRRKPFIVKGECYGTPVDIFFFRGNTFYLKYKFPLQKIILVSGVLTYNPKYQSYSFVHPDVVEPIEERESYFDVEPIYPSAAKIAQSRIRKKIMEAFTHLPNDLEEWIPPFVRAKYRWPSFYNALIEVHNPKSEKDLSLVNSAKQRLLFDESFIYHIEYLKSQYFLNGEALPLQGTGELIDKFSLPFELTSCQKTALEEILQDMKLTKPMLRLLQGDVGSGKTVVALIAALLAIESKTQVAFLVPTEILANQHFATLQKLLKDLPVNICLLTARQTPKQKLKIKADLQEGILHLVIGTHALIEDPIQFHNLGLVIIDEQHRFGVVQRLTLTQKGKFPHILSMTATPIPRTLLLAQCGDMESSFLRHKPEGRLPIITKKLPVSKISQAYTYVQKIIDKNQQIFWVCPLIEESEMLDLVSVNERIEALEKHFPNQVIIVHGKMKSKEKEAAMESFMKGEKPILLATTVVEVGVDVPNATCMVIEHAERFGLAQLHQLRGRVGRSDMSSSCLLLYKSPTTPQAKKRMDMMVESNDGFALAEADLKIRGGGELLGKKQSGYPRFKNFNSDSEMEEEHEIFASIFHLAFQAAKEVMTTPYPQLQVLENLFGKRIAGEYKISG